jgi:hypothetical protein
LATTTDSAFCLLTNIKKKTIRGTHMFKKENYFEPDYISFEDEQLIHKYRWTNDPLLGILVEGIKPEVTKMVEYFIVNYDLKNETVELKPDTLDPFDIIKWFTDNWKELFQLSEEDFSKEIVAKSSYDLYNASFMTYLIQVVLFLKLAYVHHIIHDDEMNILINLLSNPRMREYAAIAYKLFDEALMDGDTIINKKHKKLYADLLTSVLLKKNISSEEVKDILEKHKGE